jgi:Ca2+-binding EF-hand superfamily protein
VGSKRRLVCYAEIGTIDSAELKTAMESLGYKKKNKMAYQMIENMKQGEIDFNAYA